MSYSMSYQKFTVRTDSHECPPPPLPPPQAPPTCCATLRLLDVVEPERRQVQHLSSLHAAAQWPRPLVLRVLLQVRVQGVQRDPRNLSHRLSW